MSTPTTPFRPARWQVVAAAVSLAACGGDERSAIGGRAAAVTNGERTMAYPEVVAIMGSTATGGDRICTGTLISPYVVLTAKHCVFEEQPDGTYLEAAPNRFLVLVSDDVTELGAVDLEIPLEVRYPGRRYTRADLGGDDIAAILMPRAFEFPLGYVAPESPAVGDTLTVVGFGRTISETEGDVGRKYVGTTTVDFVGTEIICTGPSRTCAGDSGGPAFDSRGDIVGVVSAGDEGCVGRSYFAPVARHAAFIDEVIRFVPPPWDPDPPPDAGAPPLDAGPSDSGASVDAGEPRPRGKSSDAGCAIAPTTTRPPTDPAAVIGLLLLVLRLTAAGRKRIAPSGWGGQPLGIDGCKNPR